MVRHLATSTRGKRSGNCAFETGVLVSTVRVRRAELISVEDIVDQLLLTPIQAAAALGVGRSTVYELLRAGDLQSVRIGASRRIPADALNAFLATLLRTS